MDPGQTVWSGFTLFGQEASKIFQQKTKADNFCCDWRFKGDNDNFYLHWPNREIIKSYLLKKSKMVSVADYKCNGMCAKTDLCNTIKFTIDHVLSSTLFLNLLLGNFACFFVVCQFFSKFKKNSFRNSTFCRAWSGSKLIANVISRFLVSAYYLCKQFGLRLGPIEHQFRSRSEPLETLIVFLNEFFKKL